MLIVNVIVYALYAKIAGQCANKKKKCKKDARSPREFLKKAHVDAIFSAHYRDISFQTN